MRLVERRALVVLLTIVMVSAALVAAVSGSARAASASNGPTAAKIGTTAPVNLSPAAPVPDPILQRFLNGASAAPSYWGKMSSSVRSAALAASGSMQIAIFTDDVTELGSWLRSAGVATLVGSVPSTYSGLRVVTLEVPANLLEKIAALDHVVAVAPAVVPQAPDQADPDLPARSDAAGPAPTIIEAGKGHHVPDAWALGYDGTGITVAVMDSGVDFGHPDLQGTFAREQDSGSSYYNWPLAFDPNSMALYMLAGLTFPSAPGSWYVNTSFTSPADGAGDLSAPFNGHIYNVLGIPSASGIYHLGFHPDGTLPYYWDEVPAVLVTDSVSPGVYDTVYVDLNDDYVFGNDKPADVSSPEIWADYYDAGSDTLDFSSYTSGDGIADMSGGMIYFIADGYNPIPYSDVIGDRYGLPVPTPSSGDLVAFMIGDATSPGGDHGTLCASAIVAQNVTGHVLGFAPGAKLIAVGNIYAGGFGYDIYQFVGEGYDGEADTGDEAQVASASFGYSGVFNDGWDYEARFVELISLINMGTAFTVSTGNGGHGFGTVTSPGSSNGVISVGASTSYNKQLGAEGFEDADHSTFGDVQPWSNRGPSALGMAKPDVVTVGAWATGDGAVNAFFFSEPWTVWGGTSLSAPATAGIVALIAEAWLGNGLGIPWVNFIGKLLLVDGADNIHYDPQVMGHGLANAYRSVLTASVQGGIVAADSDTMVGLPNADWAAGDYRGTEYMSFAHIMSPGQTNNTTFQILNFNGVNGDDITISDWELQLEASQTFWINATNAEESAHDFVRPDYLINVTPDIPVGTNLMKVTLSFPYNQFDPNGNYVRDSSWRVVMYDWKDYNANGTYWNDTNGNGVVNAGEMDNSAGTEIMRFTYGYPTGTNIEAFVHDPLSRIHDGLLLGIQHRFNSTAVPFTNMTITVDYYEAVDAPWLSTDITAATLPPMGGAVVVFNVTLPADQPFGTLSAMVTIANSTGVETQVPVVVNVAATGTDFAFGGDPTSTAFLDNNRMFGGIDWTWRAEAGDWRFFFTDIPDSTPINPGDSLLVHTSWENVPTDIDTLIMGPTPDFQFSGPGSPWGPYTLATVGASANALISAGAWRFQTATGGAEEWVAAPLQAGLHEIALHNVNYAGLSPSEVFSGEAGRFSLTPNPWFVTTPNSTGSDPFAVSASLTLPGLDALAFGISQPTAVFGEPITDGGSWVDFFTATDIGLIDLQLDQSYPQGMDIDLYLYRWTGSSYALVASSAGPTAQERIRLTMPADGDYAVLVDGYSVPSGTGYFDYFQAVVAGSMLIPTDLPATSIPAGTASGFNVTWDLDPSVRPGSYLGVLFVGPTGAPAIELDAVFTLFDDNAPEILSTTPADGSFTNVKSPTITVDYVDPQVSSGIVSVQFVLDGMDLSFFGSFNETQFVWSTPFDLADGTHDLNVTVRDAWGFSMSYTWAFTIDSAAPPLSVTSPSYALTNVATATVAGTTELGATVTVNGNGVTVGGGGAFSTSVSLAAGLNTITVVATDDAGNSATVVKTVTLDTAPPAVAITAPPDGAVVNTGVVHVTGTAEPGAQVTVNGVQVVPSGGGAWSLDLAFSDGVHTISAVATDAAGNSATASRAVTVDTTAPALSVTSPAFTLTNAATATVAGTTEVGATVTVNGNAVTVGSGGAFSTSVTLAAGSNTITVVATDAAGNAATVVRTVTLDATAPVVTVSTPADGTRTNLSTVVVSGTVDDPTATVLVNGIQVHPNAQGAWSVSVALSEGSNTIAVSAMDLAGNQASAVTRSVTFTSPVPGLQNGINQNEQAISDAMGTLWIALIVAIVVAGVFAFVVYYVLNRKIGRGPAKIELPPKEDMGEP